MNKESLEKFQKSFAFQLLVPQQCSIFIHRQTKTYTMIVFGFTHLEIPKWSLEKERLFSKNAHTSFQIGKVINFQWQLTFALTIFRDIVISRGKKQIDVLWWGWKTLPLCQTITIQKYTMFRMNNNMILNGNCLNKWLH